MPDTSLLHELGPAIPVVAGGIVGFVSSLAGVIWTTRAQRKQLRETHRLTVEDARLTRVREAYATLLRFAVECRDTVQVTAQRRQGETRDIYPDKDLRKKAADAFVVLQLEELDANVAGAYQRFLESYADCRNLLAQRKEAFNKETVDEEGSSTVNADITADIETKIETKQEALGYAIGEMGLAMRQRMGSSKGAGITPLRWWFRWRRSRQ